MTLEPCVRMGSRWIVPARDRRIGGWAKTVSGARFYRFFAFTIFVEAERGSVALALYRILTHDSPDF